MAARRDLLQGTLDLLVLRTLELQPLHGIAIADRIHQVTGGTFDVGPGSLFPALHRLEREGWVKGEWGQSDNNRRARFYKLTPAGRKQLKQEEADFERILEAILRVMQPA